VWDPGAASLLLPSGLTASSPRLNSPFTSSRVREILLLVKDRVATRRGVSRENSLTQKQPFCLQMYHLIQGGDIAFICRQNRGN
jgi:hypothetical protein